MGRQLICCCSVNDSHGEEGLGDEEYPKLAGLDENYLLEQMALIKKDLPGRPAGQDCNAETNSAPTFNSNNTNIVRA